MTSFRDMLLHFVEQSNTIFSLVVVFLILTIGKCGGYQTPGGGSLSLGARKDNLSSHTSQWFSDTPFQQIRSSSFSLYCKGGILPLVDSLVIVATVPSMVL